MAESSAEREPRKKKSRASADRRKPKPPEPIEEAGDEEIRARDAAELLGLKPSTVPGYIRSGRLPGRYDGEPAWRGWLTTRAAVEAYRLERDEPR